MKITITIPDSTYKKLRKRAADESISVSDLIVRAIEQYLEDRKLKFRMRVRLPIVRSKRPGKLRINNAKICNLTSFP
jgi:predicted CopG family antitoxin